MTERAQWILPTWRGPPLQAYLLLLLLLWSQVGPRWAERGAGAPTSSKVSVSTRFDWSVAFQDASKWCLSIKAALLTKGPFSLTQEPCRQSPAIQVDRRWPIGRWTAALFSSRIPPKYPWVACQLHLCSSQPNQSNQMSAADSTNLMKLHKPKFLEDKLVLQPLYKNISTRSSGSKPSQKNLSDIQKSLRLRKADHIFLHKF